MYTFRNDGVSSADFTLVAKPVLLPDLADYSFERIEYPHVDFTSRSAAYHYDKAEDSEEVMQLKKAIDEYNAYTEKLETIPGFKAFFVEHRFCVSRSEISKHWSEEVADIVFSNKNYIFNTDLKRFKNHLIDGSITIRYSVEISGTELILPIGSSDADDYPKEIDHKHIIWNWVDNGHDLCAGLWEILGMPHRQGDHDDEYDETEPSDSEVVYPNFEYYYEFRKQPPELQLVRIFAKLENLGYIKTYTIVPDRDDFIWEYRGKTGGSIDCAVVDMSFQKNKLVMEQIQKLLWTPTDELKEKPYFITTGQNIQVLSSFPGTLGGHKKLKIYGRLDCPSAARYLAKGQYAKNRVFFADENTAISAGYHPCAICMPEAYKIWKTQNDK